MRLTLTLSVDCWSKKGSTIFLNTKTDKHTLILADSPTSHQPFPGYEQIKLRPIIEIAAADDPEQIRDFASEMNHLTGTFTHTDYDFEKPRSDLTSRSQIPGQYSKSSFEVYDYPGEYVKHEDGDTWARTRMEEIHSPIQSATGWGHTRGIVPGSIFTLAESPFSEDNRSYLVTSAQYELRPTEFETGSEGADQVFQCQFEVQPSDTQFRSARVTEKPKAYRSSNCGRGWPTGRQRSTDKYGRIKVQFHWDSRGEKATKTASCWMRVAQSVDRPAVGIDFHSTGWTGSDCGLPRR